jgi:hypothetical protein
MVMQFEVNLNYNPIGKENNKGSTDTIGSNNNKLDEWKECRSSIARFDEAIRDIRKFGFTMLTGILSANSYLFVTITSFSYLEKFGISIITLLLIFALFRIDRYHEIYLMGAVQTALDLEEDIGYNLTKNISSNIRNATTDEWGSGLYFGFGIITILPPLVTTIALDIKNIEANLEFIIAMIATIMVFSIIFIYYDLVTRYKVNWPDSPEQVILHYIETGERIDLKNKTEDEVNKPNEEEKEENKTENEINKADKEEDKSEKKVGESIIQHNNIKEIMNKYGLGIDELVDILYLLMRYHNVRIDDKELFIKKKKVNDFDKLLMIRRKKRYKNVIKKIMAPDIEEEKWYQKIQKIFKKLSSKSSDSQKPNA